MKSINQVNGLVSANPTINYYKELGKQYEQYNSTNYRNRYFNFRLNDRHISNITIAGNFIFCAAEKEFTRIVGGNGYDYARDNRQIYFEIDFSGYVLQFQVRLSQSIYGVWLSVETNFKPLQNHNTKHSFKIKSNSTFAELDIKQYFESRILNKYLFAPGLFRNIQILRNCSKKEAIQYYKDIVKPMVTNRAEIDTLRGWKQLFKRRLNIEIADSISERALPTVYKQLEPQKTRKKLFLNPSIFELSDRYCSQYDTDGHEFEFIDEVFNDYPKNSIFI
jgi:hypothetical protein